jgi:2,3-bisphosphoglycerate-dependent phosphoglycerate mutase
LQNYHFNKITYIIDPVLNEVDYGIDEGQTEAMVIQRLGPEALNAWEEHNIVPNGWNIQPQLLIDNWQGFIENFLTNPKMQKIMLVTSNGLARFLPLALNLPVKMSKIATGSISKICFRPQQQAFIEYWNIRP